MFKKLRKEKDEWQTQMELDGRGWQINGLPDSGGYCFVGDRLVGYDFDTCFDYNYFKSPNIFNRIKMWIRSWKLFLIHKHKEKTNGRRKMA